MTYTLRVFTDKVFGMTSTCPECKRPMAATGKLLFDSAPLSRWVVQYYCARCQEFFSICSPEREALINAIVQEEPKEDIT
jgi:hypothetical protein